MQRFLFRVQYSYRDPDEADSYESVCVRAADGDEASARAEVMDATARYARVMNATRTLTLVLTTADA